MVRLVSILGNSSGLGRRLMTSFSPALAKVLVHLGSQLLSLNFSLEPSQSRHRLRRHRCSLCKQKTYTFLKDTPPWEFCIPALNIILTSNSTFCNSTYSNCIHTNGTNSQNICKHCTVQQDDNPTFLKFYILGIQSGRHKFQDGILARPELRFFNVSLGRKTGVRLECTPDFCPVWAQIGDSWRFGSVTKT